MPDNATEYFIGLEAVAGTTAAAASGVMALTFELVRAGIIPADAGLRVGEAMVRSMQRKAGQAARREIADAIKAGFTQMAMAAE